jgi:uncharacterized phiE125 gp8 family phage protein
VNVQTCYYPVTVPVRAAEPTFEQEPVTLKEAKYQCRVPEDVGYHDEALRAKIIAARKQVERDAGLVCYTGSFTWKLTQFPYRDWLEFPSTLRPVTAIGSITYVASDGDTDTWDSSNYTLDSSPIMPLIRLVYGESWPTVRGDINGITVTATAGYTTVLAIPQTVKQAVLLALHIGWLFENEQPDLAMKQQQGYDRWIDLLRRETVA